MEAKITAIKQSLLLIHHHNKQTVDASKKQLTCYHDNDILYVRLLYKTTLCFHVTTIIAINYFKLAVILSIRSAYIYANDRSE